MAVNVQVVAIKIIINWDKAEFFVEMLTSETYSTPQIGL